MVGNFIADAVKGSRLNDYADEIRKGISLHRRIDAFTDAHDVVRKSKSRLYAKYHKYANVIVDIFYDHFLAVQWNNYSSIPFREYCDNIYAMLSDHQPVFPAKSYAFFQYLKMTDIFFHYQSLKGISIALAGLSRRTTFTSNMHLAHKDLRKDYDLFKIEFELFFSDIRREIGMNSF